MSHDVALAVLFAAAIHAAWNAAIKRGRDPLFETTMVHAWVAAPATIAVLLLPLPGPAAAVCIAASTAIHTVQVASGRIGQYSPS